MASTQTDVEGTTTAIAVLSDATRTDLVVASAPMAPIAEIAALAPEEMARRLRALAADLKLAYAPNSQRVWRASWRVWVAFCASQPCPLLPASVDSLRAFLEARIAAGIKRSTLDGNLWTLELVHKLGRLDWPLHTFEGELMWRGIRKTLPKRQEQKQGLSIDDIERILATLDPAVARDARDAALLLVGYETALRRWFLVALQVKDVRWQRDGSAHVLVERDKTDQEGKGRVIALSAEASACLRHWLELANITEGALFRSCPRSNKPDRFATPLGDREVARAFKRRAAAIGLNADAIAGHSTRIGSAQDLAADGESGAAICRQIGWKSESSLFRYIEHLEASRGAMPQFLKRRKQRKQNQQGG